MRWLSLVALISLCGVSGLAEQTAPETAGGFTGLREGRAVVVIFDRQQVAAVCERGDSLMNGLLIGLTVGAGPFGAIGLGVGAGIDTLIPGRRLVYQRPPGMEEHAISVMPAPRLGVPRRQARWQPHADRDAAVTLLIPGAVLVSDRSAPPAVWRLHQGGRYV